MGADLDHQDPSPWPLSHCEVVYNRFALHLRLKRIKDLGCQDPSVITALAI